LNQTRRNAKYLLEYSEALMRAFLRRVPKGTYRAEDFMDNDGISDKPIKIAVTLRFGKDVTVDFTGATRRSKAVSTP